MDLDAIGRAISDAIGRTLPTGSAWPLGGGDINSAYRYEAGEESWFVKVNRDDRLPMFEAEAAGLALLAQPGAPRVPAVVTSGMADGYAFLVLEYIPLKAANAAAQARLGERLAVLHDVTAERFGWERDNTIGTTPQINTPTDDWVTFYRERRLRPQLALAADNGHAQLLALAEPLLARLEVLFAGYSPRPSLLHGDLWAGNAAVSTAGEPVIFDPACYFGDRETDIAMTELFGGFTGSFYDAYRQAMPLDAGYPVRRDLYQLYHVLNHLNLFGGGYRARAANLIERLRAEL
jgi:protein-ribulosamine 3-kinase